MDNGKINFGEFEIDRRARKLTRGSEEIRLSPKAFDLLAFLSANPGRVITKEEILDNVWDGQFVEEANLAVQISSLRKALHDRKESPRILATIPGKGYEFIADVEPEVEIVVESHKFSRVVIDDSNGVEAAEVGGRIDRSPTRRLVTAAVSVIVLLVAAAGSYFVFLRAAAERPALLNIQDFEVDRMTTTGKVATAAAISPDGKLFAYSQYDNDGGQTLWLGHADGGEPRQLRDPAHINYTGLRFGPDGRHLYFVGSNQKGGRSLFRMPVFGGAAEPIKDEVYANVAFAPDGDRFAYIRPEDPALMIGHVDGSPVSELAKAPTSLGFVRSSQSWSPDGTIVAIGSPTNDVGSEHEIFTVDIARRNLKVLTSHKWSRIDSTAWLRDGTGLVVIATENDSRLGQLWHVGFPGGEVRPLTSDLNIYETTVSLSESNDAMIAIQLQQFSNVWVGAADDPAKARQITFSSLGRIDGWSGLDWMSDGRMVYTAVVDKISSIWMMDSDGRNPRQITPTGQSCFHPSVSNDRQNIVFTSVRDGKSSIWRTNGDGAALTQLTGAEIAAQPHISPDGRWVVYVGSRDTFGPLYRIPAGGGEPRLLTNTRAAWVRVSPDSRFIAGEFHVDGKSRLGIISIDGGDPVKVFDVPRTANFRLGVRWSPDGRSIAYRDWVNGIWLQNLDGGEPKRIEGLPTEKLYAFGWSTDGKQFAFVRGSEIRDVVMMRKVR
jgi:Tol biopolymer transport system component/DNA-binding winged helix-turn-helix (wHTH) protein